MINIFFIFPQNRNICVVPNIQKFIIPTWHGTRNLIVTGVKICEFTCKVLSSL